MALTRMMISTLPHGTVSGSAFDDSTIIKDLTDATLTRIIVYHGMHIYGLTVSYPIFLFPKLAENSKIDALYR